MPPRPDPACDIVVPQTAARDRNAANPASNPEIVARQLERSHLAENFAHARDAAEAANRAKSAFIANMSHELRTPMNGVLGMAELLAMTKLDSEQREYLAALRGSGAALMANVEDILDLSQIEAGLLSLDDVPFDLGDLVVAALTPLENEIAEKGLARSYPAAPDLRSRHGDLPPAGGLDERPHLGGQRAGPRQHLLLHGAPDARSGLNAACRRAKPA